MARAPMIYRWTFDIPVERALLWRFVSDTERINRLAGMFSVRYRYRPLESGGSEVTAEARLAGMTLRWVERPCEWVEPEHFRFTRDYQQGPFLKIVASNTLEAREDGSTRVVMQLDVTPRGLLGRLVTPFAIGRRLRRGFERAYAFAEPWARGETLSIMGREVSGQGERARSELRRVVVPIGEALGIAPSVEKLIALLTEGEGAEIGSLAPYVLADRWGESRATLVRLFLQATKAGVFDVSYNLICPSCRRSKAAFGRMKEIPTEGHCDSCNISFGVDFDRAVEVRFSPAPLGLVVEPVQYCHAGPRNTPHRVANWVIPAGETRTLHVTPGAGRHQLSSPQCAPAIFCEVCDSGVKRAEIGLKPEGLMGVPERLRTGDLALTVKNELGLAAELTLSRTRWADDALTAAEISAMQDFRDLFGSEVLAPGAEFALRNMVFLFSDLVSSTEMYQRIGDAPAFALVRDHFDLLKAIYIRHEGSLVKTIGDAVMAVFRRPSSALRAALEMLDAISTITIKGEQDRPLQLRIGLHRGPCIVMEANELVDFFGTTVNLAARVQAVAGAGEVTLSAAMLDDPEVAALVEAHGAAASKKVLRLKGIRGKQTLTVLTCGAQPDPAP